jgi:5-methylthioadenosine/S-adenosylhomocysteine deaminase
VSGLAVAGALLDRRPVGLRCVNGVIEAIGSEVSPEPGDEVIDAGGAHLTAPLLNGHTHAAMTLFRGHGDDLPLMRWLREVVWPAEARLEPEDVYWGTRLACAEMIRSGTTRFWDMYWHPGETARAAADAGMRATVGAALIDADGDRAGLRRMAEEGFKRVSEHGPLATPALAPHAIYTVSEESLRWVAGLSAERDLPVQIHLSETEEEVANCLDAHGVRPAFHLDRLGLLGPRTVLAHGVWLDGDELELIAERGATVVTNPVANMKLAVGGVFPYPAARAAGVAVALGTDGAGSNNSLDLLADAKAFALIQKHASADPTAAAAGEVWALATGAQAPALGATPLAPGEPADFLLLRPGLPELEIGDLTSNLVYAASGAVVDTTVVAGRVLMRDGRIEGMDDVLAQARERASRLTAG